MRHEHPWMHGSRAARKTPVRRGHGQPSHAPVTRGGVFVQEQYGTFRIDKDGATVEPVFVGESK